MKTNKYIFLAAIYISLTMTALVTGCKTKPPKESSKPIDTTLIKYTGGPIVFPKKVKGNPVFIFATDSKVKALTNGKVKGGQSIIHQQAAAGATIGAVTTDAPKKTIAKDKTKSKPVEKLKGQNAIKGDGNTATAKMDNSLVWIIIAIVAGGSFLYWKFG